MGGGHGVGDRRDDLTAAARPVEAAGAGGPRPLLQAVQPIHVVDRLEHAVGQCCVVGVEHGAVVVAQRHAGEGAREREDRHAVEDILQHLELEAAAAAFGHDRDPRLVEVGRDVGHRPGEMGREVLLAELLQEGFVAAADGLQLGAGIGEQRIGDVDELGKVHALGDPVEAADDDGPARQHRRDPPLVDAAAAIAGRQHVHRLVAALLAVKRHVLMGDRRDEVDGVDQLALQARHLQRVQPNRLALQEQWLALGDLAAQAAFVVVRHVDETRAIAAAGIVLEHGRQRPAGRDAVEHDAVPGVAPQELAQHAPHARGAAAIGDVRQRRGEAAPARMRVVGRQPPHDMLGALAVGAWRIGAAEPQHLDVAAGRGHRIDQAAGVDVLTVVARLGVGHREPQAPDGRPTFTLRTRCGL